MATTRREFIASSLICSSAFSPHSVFGNNAPKYTLHRFHSEVTPPLGHALMGGGVEPARQVEDPLEVYGLILVGAEKPIAIVAVDWCEIRNESYDLWRRTIAEAIGTVPERVLVSSLHQHDAPIADSAAERYLLEAKANASVCDLKFLDRVVHRVATAAKASLKEGQPITHLGTGKAKVDRIASNRRYLLGGDVRYNRTSATRDAEIRAAEEGLIDPELKMLSFWNGDTPLATISAYATHPMSYYGKGGITADFVGFARRQLQAKHPQLSHFYISGCSGNVTAGKYNDGHHDNRPVLAQRLYQAMESAWQNTQRHPLETVRFRNVPLVLKPRPEEEFQRAKLMQRLQEDPKPFGRCLAALGLSWLDRCESGQAIDLPMIDFGQACYVVQPAEAYVEYQLFAQQLRPNAMVMVAGYGECGPGYIPIERAWKENDHNLTDWCWVSPGSEQIMKSALQKLMKS